MMEKEDYLLAYIKVLSEVGESYRIPKVCDELEKLLGINRNVVDVTVNVNVAEIKTEEVLKEMEKSIKNQARRS
jgi:hypothetical protein